MNFSNIPDQPFVFNKVSQSRNVLSTFGTIALDRELTMVGDNGLITTDGNAIGRYDSKIPDLAVTGIDQANFARCYGIRYDPYWQTWLLYTESGQTRNNRVLVFNYMDRSWSIYRIPNYQNPSDLDPNDGLTCLGNYFSQNSDPTFGDYGTTLPDLAFEDFQNETFASLTENSSLILLAGDYKGNVWQMESGGGDQAGNVVYSQAYTDGYPINATLVSRKWFPFAKVATASQFGYVDFLINQDLQTNVQVSFYIDNQATAYKVNSFVCVPFENIVLSVITNITQATQAKVTAYNHGLKNNQVVFVYSVQGMTQINGLSSPVLVVDKNNILLTAINSTSFSPYIVDGILTFQASDTTQFFTRLWPNQTGVFHKMTLSTTGVNCPFSLYSIIAHFKPTGRIYKGQ